MMNITFDKTITTCMNLTIITYIFNNILFAICTSTILRSISLIKFGCVQFIQPSCKQKHLHYRNQHR